MNVPDDLEQWAADYRRARTPSAATKRRIHSAVSQGESTARDERTRWALGLALGAVAGLAALFLLSLLSGGWMLAESSSQTPQQAPAVESSRDTSQRAERDHNAPAKKRATPQAEVAAPAQPPASQTNTAERRPRRPAPRRVHEGPTPPPPTCEDDLESVRILRAAERQMANHPHKSLAQLERHAKRCPQSPFALEREALWIRAACRAGDVEGVAQRRSRFAKRADVGMYRDAIARDCDGSR